MFADKKSIQHLKQKKYLENKSDFAHIMFEKMAKDYDNICNTISFGRNLKIKEQVIKNIPIKDNMKILDVCTGTGDMSISLSQHIKSGEITGVDFSENMLKVARNKAREIKNIKFMQANALDLPFSDKKFDIAIISYGLRNLSDFKKGLQEMKRVTKNNGYIVNFDFGKSNVFINRFFEFYFFNLVPLLKQVSKKDFTLCRYIPKSNEDFPSQTELIKILAELGFKEIKNYNFVFGTLAQQIAKV